MSWMYGLHGIQGVSNVIGAIEIATAGLIALRPLSPKASFVGSLAAVLTFLLTVTFLFSTPGAAELRHGFPVLGDAGQFLIKSKIWCCWEPRFGRLRRRTGRSMDPVLSCCVLATT
jgi:reactive chlorine resistance protein C